VQECDGFKVEGRLGRPGQQLAVARRREDIPLRKDLALWLSRWCNLLEGGRQAAIAAP